MLRRLTCILVVVVAGFAGMCSAEVAAEEDKEEKEENWEYLLPGSFGGDLLGETAGLGTWKGELGMQFRSETDHGDEEDDGDAGWGYFQVSWESGPIGGLQLGLGGLFVTELWANDGFDGLFSDGGKFDENAKWTEAYLKYTLPSENTYFLLGRAKTKKFGKPAAGDGDFAEGVGVTMKEIQDLTVRAHVVRAWLDNASPSWDMDGIDKKWADMDDVSSKVDHHKGEFGDYAYTLMVDWDVIPGMFTLTPYVQTQQDVGTSYGAAFELSHAVSDSVTVGLDGAFNWFREDTPDSYWPDDGDFSQRLIHAGMEYKNFNFGVGYYSMSDDVLVLNDSRASDLGALFIVDEFDPMENDAVYGENPGNETYFVNADYTYGPFTLGAVYGQVRNGRTANGRRDGDGTELDVTLNVKLAKNLDLELFYADVDDGYSGDGDDSHKVYGGALSYKF